MLTPPVLYYGREEALPEQVELRAGPLALTYEQGDLRYIRLGDYEIVRRLYVAVHDRSWGTVPPVISDIQMNIGEDSFLIRYHVDHRLHEIDFGWEGEIRGHPEGKITFTMEGIARSSFLRNRIGFCVLHPANLAGHMAEVEHIDGAIEGTVFPTDIVPDQPVPPFGELKCILHEIFPGKWAEVAFSGDVFETEDQRNWTDASFKTFCTPLRLPFPVEIQQGTKVSQSISVRLLEREAKPIPGEEQGVSSLISAAVLSIDRTVGEMPFPAVGLGMASHGQTLTTQEIERLRGLHLEHLRLDLPLFDPNYQTRLRQAVREAQSLGVKLEAALFVSGAAEQELSGLRKELDALHPPVSAWLCYPQKEGYQGGSPIEAVVAACRRYLGGYEPSIPFYAGTNNDLIFLKRNIPPLDHIEGICFALCPQAHAYDNASLVETLEVQGKAVESARRLGKELPVRTSPVTLKMRFNPYATGPAPELQPGELPTQVDVRQMSLFGAGWTVGSYKYLAEAGTQSITFYETSGWRGVMETEGGSLLPDSFHSLPGTVFPMYHVLAAIGDFKGGRIIPVRASHPLQITGFLLRREQSERLVAANFTGYRKALRVVGLADLVSVKFLDEKNVLAAMHSPEAYRALPGVKLVVAEGFLELELEPFAIAIVDTKSDFNHLTQG